MVRILYRYREGKQLLTKGFTLIEMCIVLVAISLLSLIGLSCSNFKSQDYYAFGYDYLLNQSKALATATSQEVEGPGGEVIIFNEKGNVQQARSIIFSSINKVIVVELGEGRLEYK